MSSTHRSPSPTMRLPPLPASRPTSLDREFASAAPLPLSDDDDRVLATFAMPTTRGLFDEDAVVASSMAIVEDKTEFDVTVVATSVTGPVVPWPQYLGNIALVRFVSPFLNGMFFGMLAAVRSEITVAGGFWRALFRRPKAPPASLASAAPGVLGGRRLN